MVVKDLTFLMGLPYCLLSSLKVPQATWLEGVDVRHARKTLTMHLHYPWEWILLWLEERDIREPEPYQISYYFSCSWWFLSSTMIVSFKFDVYAFLLIFAAYIICCCSFKWSELAGRILGGGSIWSNFPITDTCKFSKFKTFTLQVCDNSNQLKYIS